MRSGCTVATGLNARTLKASTASSGKAASAGLEGSEEERRMAEAAKNLFGLSALTRWDAHEGRAIVIGIGRGLRFGGN